MDNFRNAENWDLFHFVTQFLKKEKKKKVFRWKRNQFNLFERKFRKLMHISVKPTVYSIANYSSTLAAAFFPHTSFVLHVRACYIAR